MLSGSRSSWSRAQRRRRKLQPQHRPNPKHLRLVLVQSASPVPVQVVNPSYKHLLKHYTFVILATSPPPKKANVNADKVLAENLEKVEHLQNIMHDKLRKRNSESGKKGAAASPQPSSSSTSAIGGGGNNANHMCRFTRLHV